MTARPQAKSCCAPLAHPGLFNNQAGSEELWAGGYLHTSDIAVLTPDGYVQITDRIKDVIKTGGEWVSSLQIEDLITQCPGVAEAAVIGVKDERWGERPMALVVKDAKALTAVTDTEIKTHLKVFADRASFRSTASRRKSFSSKDSPRPASVRSTRRSCVRNTAPCSVRRRLDVGSFPKTRERRFALGDFTIAEISEHVGRELGVSDWVTIEQSRIDDFADCTGDHQWIHVDVERAKRESPFRGPIAHGYLMLSMVAPLSMEIGILPKDAAAGLNYGIDKVRFLTPVPAGARVRLRVVIIGVEPREGGQAIMKTQNTLEVEGSQKPALIAETLALLIPAKGTAKQ